MRKNMPLAPGMNNQSYLDPATNAGRNSLAQTLMRVAAPPPQTVGMGRQMGAPMTGQLGLPRSAMPPLQQPQMPPPGMAIPPMGASQLPGIPTPGVPPQGLPLSPGMPPQMPQQGMPMPQQGMPPQMPPQGMPPTGG
jgi:hypothetical protein